MNWLLFTAVAILFRAVLGIMTKVLSNKLQASSYTQAFLMLSAAFMVALVSLPFLGGFNLGSNTSFGLVLLVALSQGLGNIIYFAALRHLTNGTAQITFSSILLFNTGFAVLFMNLDLSLLNFLGVLVLMGAILLATTGKVEINMRGVILMLFAAASFAVFQLASGELSKQVSAATYLLVSYGGAAVMIFFAGMRKIISDIKRVRSKELLIKIPLLTALPSVGNFLFAYYAYRAAPEPARAAMLMTAQVVVTVILSYFLLREQDHVWRKVVASVLVVCSAFLIKG